jgi:hypothetical protein
VGNQIPVDPLFPNTPSAAAEMNRAVQRGLSVEGQLSPRGTQISAFYDENGAVGKPKFNPFRIFKEGIRQRGGEMLGTPRFYNFKDFGPLLIVTGILFSANRVAKADPCNKGDVAAMETASHLGGLLIGAGVMSTSWGQAGAKAIWASPYGRGAVVALTAYSSTRQFMTETETGQVAEQFWYDAFADVWAGYYSL